MTLYSTPNNDTSWWGALKVYVTSIPRICQELHPPFSLEVFILLPPPSSSSSKPKVPSHLMPWYGNIVCTKSLDATTHVRLQSSRAFAHVSGLQLTNRSVLSAYLAYLSPWLSRKRLFPAESSPCRKRFTEMQDQSWVPIFQDWLSCSTLHVMKRFTREVW